MPGVRVKFDDIELTCVLRYMRVVRERLLVDLLWMERQAHVLSDPTTQNALLALQAEIDIVSHCIAKLWRTTQGGGRRHHHEEVEIPSRGARRDERSEFQDLRVYLKVPD